MIMSDLDPTRRATHTITLGGHRVRELHNGHIIVPRQTAGAIKWLDEHYTRVPNELRWVPIPPNKAFLAAYEGSHTGETAYIIGKGPSLDHLTLADLGTGPIIGVNEAFVAAQKLRTDSVYGVQNDSGMLDACLPTTGTLFVSPVAGTAYRGVKHVVLIPPVASYAKMTWGSAISIAAIMGCPKVIMVCFDACVTGDTTYAGCIGRQPPEWYRPKYIEHRQMILDYADSKDVELDWSIPSEASWSV